MCSLAKFYKERRKTYNGAWKWAEDDLMVTMVDDDNNSDSCGWQRRCVAAGGSFSPFPPFFPPFSLFLFLHFSFFTPASANDPIVSSLYGF